MMLAAVYVLGPTASWVGSTVADRDNAAAETARHDTPRKAIRARARVRGLLYPGLRRPLVVRVRNLRGSPTAVRRVRVRVRRASRHCPRRSLRLSRFRGWVRIKAHRTQRLRLRARMAFTAPDRCQGARYRLRVRVRATTARR